MTINEYQALAMRTNDGKIGNRVYERITEKRAYDPIMKKNSDYLGGLPDPGELLNGALGLTGEAGEVSDQIKKYIFHGHNLNTDDLVKELGDVCWYLALLCHAIGVDLETIMFQNVEKLRKRYPDGFSEAASINREA